MPRGIPNPKATPQHSDDEAEHDDGRPDQRTVPAGAAARPTTRAANSVFDIAKAAAPKRAPMPPLDVATLVVRKGVPLPVVMNNPRKGYEALWARVAPGDMVEMHERNAKGLQAWAKKQPAPQKCALRRLADGSYGVWRLA